MAIDKSPGDARLSVEVVYAERGRQLLRQIEVGPGTTALEAVRKADLGAEFPDLRPADAGIAVWGRIVEAGEVLRHGDRVEVLRPLQIDPRDARRTLAQTGQVMGGAKDPP